MKSNAKRKPHRNGIFENYATTPVPKGKRIGWVSQSMVWMGTAFCLAAFSLGGTLASTMEPVSFLLAVLLGSAILAVIGALTGSIGAKTYLSSAFNARFALGSSGGRIFGVIVAVSLFGWFGYQCAYFANSTIAALNLFGISGGSPAIWAIVGGMAMMLTAIMGFNGIIMISNMGVPLLFLLVTIAVFAAAGQTDFSALRAVSAQTAGSTSLGGGIVMVVGGFISGTCIISDMSRFSKKATDAVFSCAMAFLIGFPIILLLGGFFYYAYGTSDLCEVLITYCGLGVLAPLILIVSTWTTNDYNLYSSVLGISNALDGYIKRPQWQITLLAGIASTLLGALGILNTFVFFLNLLGVLIPPVAAVIIADYYLYNRNSGLYAYENVTKLERFRVNTCFSAAVGMLVGMLCNYVKGGFLNRLCSVVPACIIAMLASVAALVIYNKSTSREKKNE